MDNISEFLYLGFATTLFCLGIYVFFLGIGQYNSVLDKAINNYEDEYIVSMKSLEHREDIYYTRGYITALLFDPLDYDIQIDNYLINKSFHDKSRINDYRLNSDFYKKQYIYNSEGKISKVVFTKKQDRRK